jgi:hypothetical protein
MAHVIIPTKSNMAGLSALVPPLLSDPFVSLLTIVADGPQAYAAVSSSYPELDVLQTDLGAGIHAMWNLAMELTPVGQHVLFLNDDVLVTPDTVRGLEQSLNDNPELGIVCPQYAPVQVPLPYQTVTGTCGGRYDGSGGLAGFCMMLASDLSLSWRFDERMKWWCGDDDVLNWVRITQGRQAGITPLATCSNNQSWTINYDPPAHFNEIVAEDIRIYHSKTY